MIITMMVLYAFFRFLPGLLYAIYFHLKLRIQLITIPGPITLPFVGSVLATLIYSQEKLLRLISIQSMKYSKGIFVLWYGLQAAVFVRKPHQIEIILKDHTLITKGQAYAYLNDWLGQGLVTSTDELWHRHRRLLTPAFHFGVLDQFAETIFDKVQLLNNSIGLLYDEDPNRWINIFPMANKFTLDASCKTIMGLDLEVQKNDENDYGEALHSYVKLSSRRFFCFWFWSDYIFNKSKTGKMYWHSVKTMHNFTRKLIDEKMKKRREMSIVKNLDTKNKKEKGSKKIRPFLDLVIDLSEADENTLTLEEIREQVDTFMFASHDTTGISLSYLLLCLGNTPGVQDKAYNEICQIIPNDDQVPTKQQLMQLKYIDRVIKEALRLFPSAPSVMRYLTRDVDIDGYHIPKGVNLQIMIMQMHWDSEIYPEPNKFDPDRFLPENSAKRHAFAYIPFSAGPRNCIGQKFAILLLKISLVAILKQWIVHSQEAIERFKYSSEYMLTPPNDILNIRFERRKR